MDYNLDVGNRDNRRWGTRKRVTEALSPLGITALEWVCLEERLEGLNPERIWSEIQFLGMNLRGVYMPEATLEMVEEARAQVDKMGVVRVVDQDLASQMVSELQSYGEDAREVESLIGTLILSELGIQAWMAVKEALGYSIASVSSAFWRSRTLNGRSCSIPCFLTISNGCVKIAHKMRQLDVNRS